MSTAILRDQSLKQASKDEAAVRAVIESVHQAHHNKDAAGIFAGYTRDAAIFDLAPPLSHRGVDLQKKKAWLDSWDGPIDLETRDLNVTVSGDSAFCHGFRRMSGNPKAAGGQRVSFWMRATVCLRRNGDAWQIIHEHTSVPFYMDGSLRPAFDLNP